MGLETPDFTWNQKIIPPIARQNVYLLLHWVKQNVPCLRGPMPQPWTEAVLQKLKSANVPQNLISELFRLARESGYNFPASITEFYFKPGKPQQPTIDVPRKGKMDPVNLQIIAERLELKYIRAQFDGDAVAMAAAIVELLRILADMLLAHGEALQIGANEAHREWLEFDSSVTQALERAHNLETHVRKLSRAEIVRLKAAPTPDAIQYVKTEVLPRSSPPSRRAVRRK